MNVELITKADLEQFKKELFEELKQGKTGPETNEKNWLKSAEVRRLLKISPGTLQNLRISGTLSFTKVGGMMYYKLSDIEKLLEGGTK